MVATDPITQTRILADIPNVIKNFGHFGSYILV